MDEDYARRLRNWLRAEPGGTSEEREWLRGIPEPASDEQADSPQRWTVRGRLPDPPAPEDDDWVCPVIALPLPRSSGENGCRMSDAEARSRRNHPTNADHRVQAPTPVSDAEARSRWNHPTNWHRRRRAAADDQPRRDEPGGR